MITNNWTSLNHEVARLTNHTRPMGNGSLFEATVLRAARNNVMGLITLFQPNSPQLKWIGQICLGFKGMLSSSVNV